MRGRRLVSVCVLAALVGAFACGGEAPQGSNPNPPPSAAPPAASAQPSLVEEGFLKDYNIILFNKRYYALAQAEGAFDAVKADQGGYQRCFIATTLDLLKEMVKGAVQAGFGDTSTMLIEQGYRDKFNIIRSHAKYYALAQDEGAFEYDKAERRGYKQMFAGSSMAEVKKQIP